MDKLQNAIVIFGLENGQYTLNDIKQAYRKLASVNHPDKGGNTETMQLINTAFAELCKYFETNRTLDINQDNNEAAHHFDFSFLDTLKTLYGVIIEVCGYWVWLSGNTFPHKETISNLGFKFSGAKKSWYWSPTINVTNFRRGSKSMKQIRKDYGSQIIETEKQELFTSISGISHLLHKTAVINQTKNKPYGVIIMTTISKEYAKDIVNTIYQQLGGSKFTAMTGAKLSYTVNSKQQPVLRCLLPPDIQIKNNINLALITYNIGLDVYEYTFMDIRRNTENRIIKQIDEAYADELIPYFEEETGLYCYL